MPVAPGVRHVVWDWNGTLLDDTGLCVEIINGMLGRRGLPPVTLRFYRAVIEFPVVLYYRKLGFDFDAEPFERISNEFVSLYRRGWRRCGLQPEAREAMARLRAAGVGQSVLSASREDHLAEQLRHYAVDALLDAFAGVDNHHGHGKAHIAREHVRALGVAPGDVVFVGDTQHDAEAAAEAGCRCMLVSFGHYGRERLTHLGWPVADGMPGVAEMLL